MNATRQNIRGFSFVEMIIYVAVVTTVAVSSVSFLLSLQDVLARQEAERMIGNTAAVAFERILFETRQAESLNTGQSILNSSSSVLAIDRGANTLQFNVATGTLYISENGVVTGALTPPDVLVNDFYVYHYDNSRTEMVRIVANIEATFASSTITDRLEGAVVLRGTYE